MKHYREVDEYILILTQGSVYDIFKDFLVKYLVNTDL